MGVGPGNCSQSYFVPHSDAQVFRLWAWELHCNILLIYSNDRTLKQCAHMGHTHLNICSLFQKLNVKERS